MNRNTHQTRNDNLLMKNNRRYYESLTSEATGGISSFVVNENQEYLYTKKTLQPWHRFATQYFRRNYDCALEVGCGNGALLESIKAKRRIGLELDPQAAGLVDSGRVELLMTRLEDFANDPINSETCDVIFAFEVIEHCVDPVDFIQCCRRLLKPGGMLVGSTPNSNRWWLDWFPREVFDFPPNHFARFSPEQIGCILTDCKMERLYLGTAFVHQGWRHVYYRVKIVVSDLVDLSGWVRFLVYGISVVVEPVFWAGNLTRKKYLHHGFAARKPLT